MTSSNKEILETLETLIRAGAVGFDTGHNEEKHYNVIYNKLSNFNEVFSPGEIEDLPESKNMKEAIKLGYNDDAIIEYCKNKTNEALKKAKESGKPEKYDTTGLLSCKCKDEECSWDYVDMYVTSQGEKYYIRNHMY